MDKASQDITWRVLPKEFKEEVKGDYAELNSVNVYLLGKVALNNEECDRCHAIQEKMALYEKYFGKHNLTSDDEGEEMLTVPRQTVQRFMRALDPRRLK